MRPLDIWTGLTTQVCTFDNSKTTTTCTIALSRLRLLSEPIFTIHPLQIKLVINEPDYQWTKREAEAAVKINNCQVTTGVDAIYVFSIQRTRAVNRHVSSWNIRSIFNCIQVRSLIWVILSDVYISRQAYWNIRSMVVAAWPDYSYESRLKEVLYKTNTIKR